MYVPIGLLLELPNDQSSLRYCLVFRPTMEPVVMAATDTRRRVKVYSFNENMQWEDMGTGHVSMNYVERLQSLIIMVRSEEDGKSFRSGGCWPLA